MMAWASASSCIAAWMARFLADLVSRSDAAAMDLGVALGESCDSTTVAIVELSALVQVILPFYVAFPYVSG
jgi:hypothetical protein